MATDQFSTVSASEVIPPGDTAYLTILIPPSFRDTFNVYINDRDNKLSPTPNKEGLIVLITSSASMMKVW